MIPETQFLSALLVGLLGGVHCAGMCGGIVGALTFSLSDDMKRDLPAALPFHLAYSIGRIGSYALAGGLMAGLGATLTSMEEMDAVRQGLRLAAAGFMIALGLYLAGWWNGLARVETLGGALVWRRLEPLGRRFIPVRTPLQALAVGAVWGWLPCGLVYTVLLWTLAMESAAAGAWVMLGFGIGTLPNLLAMGLFASAMAAWLRSLWLRRFAGITVIGFGIYNLFL